MYLLVYKTPFSPLKMNRCFEAEQSYGCYILYAGFLLVLFFDPEDGGDIFLKNSSWLSKD
jgi:hypothetical protein